MSCRLAPRFGIAIPSVLVVSVGFAAAAERTLTLDPAASQITFTLDTTFHEVHGTMALTGGFVRFDPETGAASGEIAVDARRAATGNAKRDSTMHAEVLESDRFPTIVFRMERVEGRLADPGGSDLRLVGVLTLHGADHPMKLQATVKSAGGRVSGEMRFSVPYVAWGLRDPSFFVVRAEKTVEVKVHAEGRWTDGLQAGP